MLVIFSQFEDKLLEDRNDISYFLLLVILALFWIYGSYLCLSKNWQVEIRSWLCQLKKSMKIIERLHDLSP